METSILIAATIIVGAFVLHATIVIKAITAATDVLSRDMKEIRHELKNKE